VPLHDLKGRVGCAIGVQRLIIPVDFMKQSILNFTRNPSSINLLIKTVWAFYAR
jgi:hypothetical protein